MKICCLSEGKMFIKRRQGALRNAGKWPSSWIQLQRLVQEFKTPKCLALTRYNWVNYDVILITAQFDFSFPGEKGKQINLLPTCFTWERKSKMILNMT